MKGAKQKIHRINHEVIHSMNWLRLAKVTYVDHKEKERTHEICERIYERGGVDVVANIKYPDVEMMLLIIQYRPAVDKYCVGFPAGLIDEERILKMQL